MNTRPFIHLFKTYKAFYFFDVLKNEIVPISEAIYNNLNSENIKEDSDITYLKQQGYLSTERFKKYKHPATDIAEYLYSNSFRRIILQITQQCNLRCLYCPYSASEVKHDYINRSHNSKCMSFSVAKKAIDFLINNSRNTEWLMITFYGGEPLLQFDLIKKCIEYANVAGEGKEIRFGMTTNGTLLTKEIMDYFIEKKILLTLSLDGPEFIHDKNRKVRNGNYSSYRRIIESIRYFREHSKEYLKNVTVNTVIDPKENYKEIVKFFNNNPDIADLNITSGIFSSNYRVNPIETSDDFQSDYRYEEFKMFLAELGRLDKKYASRILKISTEDIEKKLLLKHQCVSDEVCCEGTCTAGLARVLIDVEGNFHICEKANENSGATKFGDLDKGVDIKKVKGLLNVGIITEERCRNCWAVRLCNECALASDAGDKFSKEMREQNCVDRLRDAENSIKDYVMLTELNYQREGEGYNE